MEGFRNGLKNFGLLIARLGVGGILLLHGWQHWRAGVPELVESYTAVGAPYPEVAGWATVIFELVAGIFLIVGAHCAASASAASCAAISARPAVVQSCDTVPRNAAKSVKSRA